MSTSVSQVVKEKISEVVGKSSNEIKENLRLQEELGIDEMSLLEILVDIGNELSLPSKMQIEDLNSVQDVINHFEKSFNKK
ncbi:hypothetical protein JCM3765_007368 [Sporobolomyces pararoseus]